MKLNPISRNEKLVFLLFLLFYLSSSVSGLYSENTGEALRKLLLKIPILLFPLCYLALKNMGYGMRLKLQAILAYAVFLPAAVSVYNYFINKRLFDQLIQESKPLPIEFGYGIYHIQFSIILACSIVFSVYTLVAQFRDKRMDAWSWFLLLSTLFNFFAIHVLSARTGLLAMYFGLLVLLLNVLWQVGRKARIYLIASAIVLPMVLFVASPSLQKRLRNSIEDLNVVIKGTNANDFSFAMRVAGWHNAIDVIKRHPLQGAGIGDADKVLHENFASFNPSIEPENRRNPHNQILESAAQSGIISSLLFVGLLVAMSFIKSHGSTALPTTAIALLLFVSSNFESILERQASVIAFSLFLAMAFAYHAGKYRIQED